MAEEADVDIEGDVTEPSRGTYESLSSPFTPDNYLDPVWKRDDELTPWTLDSTISDENRAAIEKMLLEEEYYFSNKPPAAKFWTEVKDEDKPGIKRSPQKKVARVLVRSPAKPSNGAVKWSAEEKALFEQGLAKFGRRWTSIARLIGSRTVLQVKSYARQYYKNKCKAENGEKDPKVDPAVLHLLRLEGPGGEELSAFRGRDDPNLNAVKIEKLSDDEEIDITDEKEEGLTGNGNDQSLTPAEEAGHAVTEQGEESRTSGLCHLTDLDGGYCLHASMSTTPSDAPLSSPQEEAAAASPIPPHTDLQDKNGSPLALPSPPPCEPQDEVEELKPPEQEVEIEQEVISEEEKQAISEFFEGRQAKTPERYLRIRNYILDQWKNCRPNYLNKTSVRPGLKNCGDVNCIGRIHTYLELIGAINFGCDQAVYNRPRPVDKAKSKMGKDALEAYELAHRLQTMRTRRRRVRDRWGNWCDARDLEGQTFEHLSAEELAIRREKMKQSKCAKGLRPSKSSFDPFQLIPFSDFTEEKPAPFRVRVSAEAMLILDLHAHVSMAEVIGLLGGRYSEAERVIEICAAEPCNSLSTGLQCEMDPVSQTQASEALHLRGYSVIGWYHSHPAFDPNPSIRDIDTQTKYQEVPSLNQWKNVLWSNGDTGVWRILGNTTYLSVLCQQSYFSRGGAKFLGMIISPYNRSNPLPQSQLSCLVISDDLSEDGSYRIPYRFDVEPRPGEPRWEIVFEKTRWMIEKYGHSHSSVPMNRRFRQDCDLTCLQKLLTCLRRTLVSSACTAFADQFLSRIQDYFLNSCTDLKEGNESPEDALPPGGAEGE